VSRLGDVRPAFEALAARQAAEILGQVACRRKLTTGYSVFCSQKAAFIVRAKYGYGALRKVPRLSATTEQALPPTGARLGVKKFGYTLFFMTDSALT
jgi:hypothetical protein